MLKHVLWPEPLFLLGLLILKEMNTFSRVPKSMVDPRSVPTEISLGKHVQCLGKRLPGPSDPWAPLQQQAGSPRLHHLEENKCESG